MNRANHGKSAVLWGMTALAIVAVALMIAAAVLWADTLYQTALDARRQYETELNAQMTVFDLFAQESEQQTKSRISAWLNAVESQEAAVRGTRGMLRASVYEPLFQDAQAPWAIVLHGGLGSDRKQVLDIACELSVHGYRVLTPDLYGHGSSDGNASTLGFGDAQDVHAWVEYIQKMQAGAKIVIFGQDEGAVAALLAAGEGLSESVAAVAADSVFDDGLVRVREIAGYEDGSFKGMLIAAAFGARTKGKSEAISKRIASAKVPLLLIHGTGDQVVPAWQSEDIALAAGENAKLLYIEGAGHGLSRFVDSQTYYGELLSFYENSLK